MKYDCPSCGQPFNGKRCRNCGYESFDEEIAHRLHTHKGEPLVIQDTQRRPIPRSDPFGCPPKKKREQTRSRSWPSIVITICCLLTVLLSAAKDLPFLQQPIGNPFSFLNKSEVTLPEDTIELYSGDIDVYAQWDPAVGLVDHFPLYIRNNTSKKIQVEAKNLTINGFNLDGYTFFRLTVPANSLEKDFLYLDTDSLEFCQIAQLKTMILQFLLEDPYTSAEKGATGYCSFPVKAPADYVQPACDDGPLIFEDENLRVIFRGIRSASTASETAAPQLLFYVENKTGAELFICTFSDSDSDEHLDLAVTLPPCSKTVAQVVCSDVDTLSGVDSISTTLHYTDLDQLNFSQDVTIPLN